MYLEGHIEVWFNKSSYFKMEFNKVSVQEGLDLLRILQNALKSTPVQESSMWPTNDKPALQADGGHKQHE